MPDKNTTSENEAYVRAPNGADPFDLKRLRLGQDFAESVGVKKVTNTVPVRKPDRQAFVRVHPEPEFRLDTALLTLKEERGEAFLVDPILWPDLASEIVPTALFAAMTRQNVAFLWPVRLPRPDGRIDDWSRSALEAAEHAMRKWVRVVANMQLGAYETYIARDVLDEPVWPEDMSFEALVRIAFRGRFIDSLDHPAVKRLRGEF